MKVAFSLLHYNNVDVTKKAVEYLKKLDDSEIEIVVVDNASPNGSGEVLKKEYSGISNVHVILNNENVGFARGNNLGYQYARNNLGCDLIVVMNNDVFIKDREFVRKLFAVVEKSESSIIAPTIYGREGNQNPFRTAQFSTKQLYKLFLYNMLISKLYGVPGINAVYAKTRDKKDEKKAATKVITGEISGNIWAPHGACVIFTQSWIAKEKFAFVPVTFMYFEEDILAEYAYSKGHSISYDPNLVVYHVEDASVSYTTQTSIMRRKFISANMSKSIHKLIKLRRKNFVNTEYEFEE